MARPRSSSNICMGVSGSECDNFENVYFFFSFSLHNHIPLPHVLKTCKLYCRCIHASQSLSDTVNSKNFHCQGIFVVAQYYKNKYHNFVQ